MPIVLFRHSVCPPGLTIPDQDDILGSSALITDELQPHDTILPDGEWSHLDAEAFVASEGDMKRDKRFSRAKRRQVGSYESVKSMARIMVAQRSVGVYSGLFDLICDRLANRPEDPEAAELLAGLKKLSDGSVEAGEFGAGMTR